MTAERRLRIAVLGDLESIHTRRWLRAFAERGHEMHAISFYPPQAGLPAGVILHVLSAMGRHAPLKGWASPGPSPPGAASSGVASGAAAMPARVLARLPRPVLRLLHGLRYRRAGLRDVLDQLKPDVFHAHYLVEYGFYGALAGYRPYAVSAWGSDVYRELRNPLNNLIARFTMSRLDLVTANDPAMQERIRRLGPWKGRLQLVRIGALEELFFEKKPASVNLRPNKTPPTVISTRALEPLYNLESVLRAFAKVRQRVPGARLLVANEGSQRVALESEALALDLGESVRFLGRLTPEQVRDALSSAHVYVSVPSSDSLSASTMEAMARECFPVVSDLPSLNGVIEHGVSGLLVTPGDVDTLATALQRALVDADLRRRAAELNRGTVEAEGRLEAQVERLEAAFYQLVDEQA